MFMFFKVAIYQVVLEAGNEGLILPPYKGSTLRGGFGRVFRRIACSMREQDCGDCLLKGGCPYAYIFETAPPVGTKALQNYESIPRPFVLEPPLEEKTFYDPGEKLVFHLVLFGKAVDYLPYFIVAFRELGQTGIGKGRKKYVMKEIIAINPITSQQASIYREEEKLVRSVDLAIRGTDIKGLPEYFDHNTGLASSHGFTDRHAGGVQNGSPEATTTGGKIKSSNKGLEENRLSRLIIDFLTMTRIKYEKSFTSKIEFHMLMRSLLRRLSSIAYFHHGQELQLDFTGIISRSAQVKLVEDNTRWVDWERFSSRQDGKLIMGGVVGQAVYEGALDEFLPLLRLGELIHVGKGAVFGMGKYRLV